MPDYSWRVYLTFFRDFKIHIVNCHIDDLIHDVYLYGMKKHITPNKLLENHLKEGGISQRKFASDIGSHQSIVSRILKGTLRPSIDIAFKIDATTNGAVPMRIWASEAAQ